MPYSGGKFLANCLALSRHVLCNDYRIAFREIHYPGDFNSKFYNFKLQSVISSLPENFLVERRWKEFGNPPVQLQDYPKAQDKFFCHLAHFPNELDKILTPWPDTKVVRLINYYRFNEFCCALKSSMTDISCHLSGFAHWDEIKVKTDFKFNVDTIYQLDEFLTEVKRLYDFLELDDFQSDLVTKFRRAYLDVHGLDQH